MFKKILLFIAAIVAVILAWGIFKMFAKYAFLIILTVVIVALVAKFGNKN